MTFILWLLGTAVSLQSRAEFIPKQQESNIPLLFCPVQATIS